MKRHPVLANLSRDHHRALITAQSMKKGAPAFRGLPVLLQGKREYMIRFFNDELKKHFQEEETVLFPFAKEMNPEMIELIDELIGDHRAMELLIHKIEIGEEVELYLDEIGRLLETHIRKEERIFFQQLQEKLSDIQFHELQQRFIKN